MKAANRAGNSAAISASRGFLLRPLHGFLRPAFAGFARIARARQGGLGAFANIDIGTRLIGSAYALSL